MHKTPQNAGRYTLCETTMDAEKIWTETWQTLHNAVENKELDFNTAVVATARSAFETDLRTVVLRKVIPEGPALWFYTDHRSKKVEQLSVSPQISWLFYDKKSKIQLRFEGMAEICNQTPETIEIWDHLSLNGKGAYLAEPGPGTVIPGPDDGLSEWKKDHPAGEDSAHFTIIKSTVIRLDWLQLQRGGHRRICYQVDGNKWRSDWLIP